MCFFLMSAGFTYFTTHRATGINTLDKDAISATTTTNVVTRINWRGNGLW